MIVALHPLFKAILLTWLKNFSFEHVLMRKNIVIVKVLSCFDQEPLQRISETERPAKLAFGVDADWVEFPLKFPSFVIPDNSRVSLKELRNCTLSIIRVRSLFFQYEFMQVCIFYRFFRKTRCFCVFVIKAYTRHEIWVQLLIKKHASFRELSAFEF